MKKLNKERTLSPASKEAFKKLINPIIPKGKGKSNV